MTGDKPTFLDATSARAADELEDPRLRVIAPAKRRLSLGDIPRERDVIRVLAARDFKVKYKQSVLGPVWVVLQPLGLLLGFVVAFRGLAKVQSSNVPYAVFALVGLTVWSFFQTAMTIGATSIITNYGFVRYTPCPRLAFPLASVISSLPSFAITAASTIVAAAATGFLSARVLLLPVGLAWLLVLTVSIVAIFAALAVRYRDVMSALPFVLQVGVFLVPVGYSLAGLSPTVRTIVELNPLTGLIEAWRWMMLSGYHPRIAPIAISLGFTAVLVVGSWLTFSRIETTMADEI
jgi:ABC-type polysaccharide/polyol phosphate export permease